MINLSSLIRYQHYFSLIKITVDMHRHLNDTTQKSHIWMIILIMIIVILIIIYTIIIIIIIIIFMKILIQSSNFTTKFHYQLSLSAIVISIMLQDYDQGPVVKVRSLVPSSACVINTPLIFPSQYIIIFCSKTFFWLCLF